MQLQAQTPDVIKKNTLAQQTVAWNAGDLEKFMDSYWRNDSLLFIGKSGYAYGWQNVLKNYRKNYSDSAALGKLKFDLISVKRLLGLCYSVVGKYHIKQSIFGDEGGSFTLLFKKIKKQWLIVQDHSS